MVTRLQASPQTSTSWDEECGSSVAERWGRLGSFDVTAVLPRSWWDRVGDRVVGVDEPRPGSRFMSSWLFEKSTSRSTPSMSSLGAVLPTPESPVSAINFVTPSKYFCNGELMHQDTVYYFWHIRNYMTILYHIRSVMLWRPFTALMFMPMMTLSTILTSLASREARVCGISENALGGIRSRRSNCLKMAALRFNRLDTYKRKLKRVRDKNRKENDTGRVRKMQSS